MSKLTQRDPGAPDPRRRFPRADVNVKALLRAGGKGGSQFEAILPTRNIGVGGVFFESTFFLKVGQLLEVELQLPDTEATVKARGKVIRIETAEKGSRTPSGFAVRFEEYLDGSDIVLAQFFLEPKLRAFVEEYEQRQGVRVSREVNELVVSVLAAWELSKADSAVNPWTQTGRR